MQVKKNPELEVGRNSSLYFAIGLNVMLFFSWYGLNYKTYDKNDISLDIVQVEEVIEEDIPITNMEAPPPPPPPPAAAPEIINVVEDIEDIEETVIESTETDQSEQIDMEVRIEDVAIEEVEEDIEVPFAVVESVPIFPGCIGSNNEEYKKCFEEKVLKHVLDNFKYPDNAIELGIHGKVFVIFVIDTNGNVSNIRTRGPHKVLEKEAYRIVSKLPTMTPGKQRGKPVKVPFSLPINFKYVDQ